ncbi:hypothetical protein KIPE111705_36880 [Kibdelosporangium persicum]|uniref:Uncharacterized protein n=1 Tax=Kibdelosporangium persicum TaxID=2698649 RepID=A0ABX2F426_9PSEU|nr:hypothetical protein [Kibdelosporangium persicum]NRN65909.1 hypothetical protein [Kibdelosporangium persicum]
MSAQLPFWPDDGYDTVQASDGVSRYGAYLAQKRGMFLDYGEDPTPTRDRLEFAAAAWEIASSPIMAPPYVRTHPRIQSAGVAWDDQGSMAIDVVIATEDRPDLGDLRYKAAGWGRDSLSPRRWFDPQDSSRLTVLPSVLIRVPITPGDVTEPAYVNGSPVTVVAQDAVGGICDVLNRVVARVLYGLG